MNQRELMCRIDRLRGLIDNELTRRGATPALAEESACQCDEIIDAEFYDVRPSPRPIQRARSGYRPQAPRLLSLGA